MIEPTGEMRLAFDQAPGADAGCTCAICLNHRLAAVFAIVERDDRTVRVNPADLRPVLDQQHLHAHRVPGVWDGSAGRQCVECAARVRLGAALVARTTSPSSSAVDQ